MFRQSRIFLLFLFIIIVYSCQKQENTESELSDIRRQYEKAVSGFAHEKDIYLRVDWSMASRKSMSGESLYTVPINTIYSDEKGAKLEITVRNGQIVYKKIILSPRTEKYSNLYGLQASIDQKKGHKGGSVFSCQKCHPSGVPLDPVDVNPPGKPIDDWDIGLPGGGGSPNPPGNPGLRIKKFSKSDPCSNKKELNSRKKNTSILSRNSKIKDLSANTGLEHGFNTYINLNNGEITKFTEIRTGYKTGSGQEIPSYQGWHWLANDQVEVTADYNHTHPFESGPSSIDVFEGIYPYIATSDAGMTALSPAQKQVYLSYHSINVMTTNHDYAITITDPAKWVSRYTSRAADFERFKQLSKNYADEFGHDAHTAQELSLLDLYGDMIQLYRSDKDADNFEPVMSKVDPGTLRKIISKTNCN